MAHSTFSQRQSKQGFTLIELLVVISIIALLISILLPALSKARDTAEALTCLSTMRQLGLTTHMYVDDNDRMLFDRASAPGVSEFNNIREHWNARLMRGYLAPSAQTTTQIYEALGLFANCPSATKAGLTGWPQYSGALQYSQLGFNWQLIQAGANAVKFDSIRQPSATVMIGDAVLWSSPHLGSYRIYWRTGVSSTGVPHARHNGAVNIVWADGHGAAVASPNPRDLDAIFVQNLPRELFDIN